MNGFFSTHRVCSLSTTKAISATRKQLNFSGGAKILLTSNYVLAEFVPLSYVRGKIRRETLSFINDLLEVPRLELIWVDDNLHHQAMNLLENRLDKNYSLCDAVSFIIMRERGVNEALTTDKHFAQEGFIKLLKS